MKTNGWATVSLGDVVTHRKEFIRIDDLTRYKRCRVQLHTKGVVLRDEVEGAVIKTKSQQVCRPNEFLVAEIDAKVGGFGMVPPDLNGALVSSHYFLFAPRPEKLLPEFLGYYSRTPAFREQVTARGSTNYAAIRPGHVLKYTMPLPPINEQRNIVAKLEYFADKIETARKLRVQIGPETTQLTQSLLSSVFPGDSSVKSLREVIAPNSKVSYGVLVPGPDVDDGVPFIRIQDLDPVSPPLRPAKVIAREVEAPYARTRLTGNEILIAVVGATIGKVGIVPPEWAGANIARAVCRIVPGTELRREYLIAVLRSPQCQGYFREVTRTLAQPTLNVAQLLQTPVPCPPLAQQDAILVRLAGFQRQIDQLNLIHETTTTAMNALFPSILDRAFRGAL